MEILSLEFTVCMVVLSCLAQTRGIKVERVYFGTETEWAGYQPVWVMCDVTEEVDEEVQEVLYHHEGDLVYRWVFNETAEAFGLLEERVEIPRNETDWNIKITRMTGELEGNFTCTAVSDLGENSTSWFPFVVRYEPNATQDLLVNEEACCFNATFTFPRAFPRPFTLCYLVHEESAFRERLSEEETVAQNEDGTYNYRSKVSAMFTDYPEGSYLRCHDYLYGVELERLNWTIEEAPSCPPPPESHPQFELSEQLMTPGCRHGVKVGSKVIYSCLKDELVTLESVCEPSGNWSLGFSGDDWPTCSGSAVFTSWILLLSSILLHFCLF